MSSRLARPGRGHAAAVVIALVAGALAAAGCGASATPGGADTADASGDAASGHPTGDDAGNAAGDDGPASGSTDGALPPSLDAGGDTAAPAGSAITLGFIAGSNDSLYASIGGGSPHAVQLDTGSLGLYVPRSVVGSAAQISTTTTCSITYVSSGVTLSGHEGTGSIALLGSTKAGDVSPPPTTVSMTFCAVDDTTFQGGMMGVGFGRGTGSNPARDVILQMAATQSGTPHPGYVLSTHPSPHVQIGIDAATAAAFQTIPLTPAPGGTGDWLSTSLHGCLALPNNPSFGQECGPMLVDTGVADTLLWGPSDPTLGGTVPKGQTTVPNGTAVQIASPASASLVDWTYTVGSGADSPAAVSIRPASAFSINTGRALLVDYDYLFDAKAGLVGFRKSM